jgi:hypothetical protein
MSNKETKAELLQTMIKNISEVMGIMDQFQDSRSGSIAFTKLEEAIMWLQVMVHNVPFKEKNDETIVDATEEIAVA